MSTDRSHHTIALRLATSRSGVAVVEFVIVATLLLMLVFGIIDFGLLMKDYIAINQAAREGARSAAIGETTATIDQRIIASVPATALTTANIVLQKSPTGVGDWTALSDSGGMNNASAGDYVKVSVTLQHAWLTKFFSSTPQTIHAYMVSRRE